MRTISKRTKATRAELEASAAPHTPHVHGQTTGAIAGEIVGALLGAAAGPPGAVAGMVLGAAAGALAGNALDRDAERAHAHEEELDAEIGVSGGDIGAPRPAAPKT